MDAKNPARCSSDCRRLSRGACWQIMATTITTIQTTAKVCADSAYNSFDIVLQLEVYQAKFTESLLTKYRPGHIDAIRWSSFPLFASSCYLWIAWTACYTKYIHNYCIYSNYIRLKCHLQLICTITTITSMFNAARRAINACNESGKKRADANQKKRHSVLENVPHAYENGKKLIERMQNCQYRTCIQTCMTGTHDCENWKIGRTYDIFVKSIWNGKFESNHPMVRGMQWETDATPKYSGADSIPYPQKI